MRFLAASAAALYLFVRVQTALATSPDGACDLPQDLERIVAGKYPGTRIVSLPDLNEDDRALFQKEHADNCPGLVKVDFYGDGKPTLALVLIGNGEGKDSSVLVVAHWTGAGWKIS